MPLRDKTRFASGSSSRARDATYVRHPVLVGTLAFVAVLALALGVWRWLADRSLREASVSEGGWLAASIAAACLCAVVAFQIARARGEVWTRIGFEAIAADFFAVATGHATAASVG